MSWLITALQLGVAPILAGVFTMWAALVGLASESETGLPDLLVAGAGDAGTLSPARSLHIIHLALVAVGAFLAGLAMAWWTWPGPQAILRLLPAVALVWVVGDLLPRIWSANEPGLVRADGRVAKFSIAMFKPVLRFVAWADRGGRDVELVPRTRPGESEMRERLSGVFSLREMTVAEVMTPRMDVVSVDLSATRDRLIEIFRAAEHSRLLVVDGDPDNVVGVIYAKDLLNEMAARTAKPEWHDLVRGVEYVPDAKRLDRQLRDFQRGSAHLVVVADEFGGTSGIVTLEDVLEQIVGEIQDEYDTEEAVPMQRMPDGALVVMGNVPLVDLEAEVDASFEREDVGTVGGLVLAEAGRVPRIGEVLTVGEYAIRIDQVARRRVGRVTIRRLAPIQDTPAAEGGG